VSVEPWSVALQAAEIHPPAGYSPWWWAVVAACLLGIVAVGWWARRALRAAAGGDDPLQRLREETLTRIDRVADDLTSGELSAAEAAARLSAEVRRFVGTASDGDADYRVLSELRRSAVKDPRLEPMVALVEAVETWAFAPAGAATEPVGPLVEQAREVVRRWS